MIERRNFLKLAAVGALTALAGPKTATAQEVDNQIDASPDCKIAGQSWEGVASYYTRAGCLGCSGDLLMANGQPLDDNSPTLAFMKAPLGTVVNVQNLDNGQSIIATVTDLGGFERYGRIADVSDLVRRTISLKTDVSTIRITVLDC